MLSDEQIAALTPHERRDLIKRLARPVDDFAPAHAWLRRTRELRSLLVVGSAILLVCSPRTERTRSGRSSRLSWSSCRSLRC